MNSETAVVFKFALPSLIALIMFGLGLTLQPSDFARMAREPKAMILGLLVKMLGLPVSAWGLSLLFGLDPAYTVGMLVLAASPASAVATMVTHLGGGDVALALSLTAIHNALAMITLPIAAVLAARHFHGEAQQVPIQYLELLKVVVIFLIPVSLGMWVKSRSPVRAVKIERVLRRISLLVLVVLIVGVIVKESSTVINKFSTLGPAVLTFGLISLGLGYGLSRALQLARPQLLAISMFMLFQSTVIGISIAVSLLENASYAMPSAFFSLSMYLVGIPVGLFFGARLRRETAAQKAAQAV